MRFCGSCMTTAGLNPADSRLALPGCKSNRQVICDGPAHNCAIIVDQFGTQVEVTKPPTPETIPSERRLVAGHSLMS